MCKQKVALEMIEQRADKAGLSPDAIFLAEKQCEDIEMMDKRMTAIENKVDELSGKVDNLDAKVDEIKDLITQRSSFWANVKDVMSNKIVIYLIVVSIALACGVPVAQVGLGLLE